MAEPEWSWLSLTDSSASPFPPVFTKDGSYFFSIVGSNVKIYSSATGEVVSTLSCAHPRRHLPPTANENLSPSSEEVITAAILNPCNHFQLITASLNGCIMVWDFLEATLLQVFDLEQPITHLCAHEKFDGTVFIGASRPSHKRSTTGSEPDDWGIVLRVTLKATEETASKELKKSCKITALGQTRAMTGLAISASGKWVVATAAHTVYVATTSPKSKSSFIKYVSPERLTCVICHPTEDYFATGDVKGVIRLWYCLNERITVKTLGLEKKSQTTAWHWHAHAVSSLAFTSNGAYLLSGGEEAVLVIWQLHSGKKEFVPRVGAPITAISVVRPMDSEEEYLLGLADATYLFVGSGSLKATRIFSRIKIQPTGITTPSTSIPLAVHFPTSNLILPSSHPSSLQIYSPSSSRLITELEVWPSNKISRQDEKPIESSRVELAVVSSSGEWMATVDARKEDESFHGEVYLKVWWWDKKSGSWTLNTRIDRPHGLTKVTATAFSPVQDISTLQLVSTGRDGYIKTWRVRKEKVKGADEGAEEFFWIARSNFKFRSEIPNHASWSPDGSILAVSLGRYVALFDPVTTTLLHLLTFRGIPTVSSTKFLGWGGRYLVVVGRRSIVLWDLVTQSQRYLHRSDQKIQTVICHPMEESFAAFYEPVKDSSESLWTSISQYRPSSECAYAHHKVPFKLVNLVWYRASSWAVAPSSYTLAGITSTWSVVVLGDSISLPTQSGSTAREILGESHVPQRRTLFQNIFGKSAFDEPQKYVPNADPSDFPLGRANKDISTLLAGPAYLLPGLEALFGPVMSSFLVPRSVEETSDVRDETGENFPDEDVDMGEPEHISTTTVPLRVVDAQPMDLLVELFRTATVDSVGPAPTASTPEQVNGTQTKARPKHAQPPPAHHKSAINGIRPHEPLSPPPESDPSTVSPPRVSSRVTKKKRRKSAD